MLSAFWVTVNLLSVKVTAKIQNLNCTVINGYVDLKYLAEHPEEFKGVCVTTSGTVRYYASIYMFEDFWLQAQNDAKIPVVTRFAGLPDPSEGLFIEISGKIEYANLEGGFHFLNATSWKTSQATPIPNSPTTSPKPSPTPQPTKPSTAQPVTPPLESQPIQQQPNSGLTVTVEHGLIALAAIAAIVTVSTYLFYRRKKQHKPF